VPSRTDKWRMPTAHARSSKSPQPGTRALKACGDGFWEFNLLDGSVWFSDWFYQKINWPTDVRRTTLRDFQPLLQPATWNDLMGKLRGHLEQGLPLDFDLKVEIAGDRIEWWHIRGAAQRNEAGQPIYIAGGVRDVSGDVGRRCSTLPLRGAFDALPMATALLDAKGAVLEANRRWCDLPASQSTAALSRLHTANAAGALKFSLESAADREGGPRPFEVRAVPFEHHGTRHVVVTIEDRS
jgi:PAS domain-containing protein